MKHKVEKQIAIRYIIYILLAIVLMIVASGGRADPLFTVRELSFEGGKYTNNVVRNAYLNTPKSFVLSHRTAVNWNVDLMCMYSTDICFFWNNKVEGLASEAAYKYVAWDFTSGVTFRYIDIYYAHKSEHILEEERPSKAFPVSDSIMFKLKFIFKPRRYLPTMEY